jgi:hypothetical protein
LIEGRNGSKETWLIETQQPVELGWLHSPLSKNSDADTGDDIAGLRQSHISDAGAKIRDSCGLRLRIAIAAIYIDTAPKGNGIPSREAKGLLVRKGLAILKG